MLAARRAGRLAALSTELGGALAVPTDVTDPAQVRDLVAAALDRHQRIDGLVNNAGASMHGPLDQVDLAEFGQVLTRRSGLTEPTLRWNVTGSRQSGRHVQKGAP